MFNLLKETQMSDRDSFSEGQGQLEGQTDETSFKVYRLPNGHVLRFSKEEFSQVVEAFRMLLSQFIINQHKDK